MRVLFFGTDHFSLASLRRIHGGGGGLCSRIDVVTPAAAAQRWRGNSRRAPAAQGVVRGFAEEHGLGVYDAPQARSIRPRVQDWSPDPETIAANYDVGVVVSFGYFLSAEIIGAFPKGAVNVHPSLLPKYRGAAPIQHCLINGDVETGVTVQRVDPAKFDAGAILSQETAVVEPHDTFVSLSARLAEQGADQLYSVLTHIKNGTLEEREQDPLGTTQAPKIKPKHRLVSFENATAPAIYNRWRGLHAHGGVLTRFRDKDLKLHEIKVASKDDPLSGVLESGEFRVHDGRLWVGCKDQTALELTEVQIEGKKRVSGVDFANGHLQRR